MSFSKQIILPLLDYAHFIVGNGTKACVEILQSIQDEVNWRKYPRNTFFIPRSENVNLLYVLTNYVRV